MRAALLLCLLVLATACESEEGKLTRLRSDYATEKYLAIRYARLLAQPGQPADSMRVWKDSLYASQTKRDLAERSLNEFMNGR